MVENKKNNLVSGEGNGEMQDDVNLIQQQRKIRDM